MSALQSWPDQESASVGESLGYRQQRQERRVTNPVLAVQIRGKTYKSPNWSLCGMLITGYDGTLLPGDTIEIDAIGRESKTLWPVLIQGRVVRVSGTDDALEMAVQLKTVSTTAYDILEGILLRRPQYLSVAS